MVNHVQQVLGVSDRRACRVLNQPRSTQRYQPVAAPDTAVLAARVMALATPLTNEQIAHLFDRFWRGEDARAGYWRQWIGGHVQTAVPDALCCVFAVRDFVFTHLLDAIAPAPVVPTNPGS